jgi:twitching motility protein PilT
MSKPVYELPDDGEAYPPATGRRAAGAGAGPTLSPNFAQMPPPTAPADGGVPSYLNAPPPTSKPFPAPSPTAEANYANSTYPEIKFDPTAPPAAAKNVFDLGSSAGDGKPFDFGSFAAPSVPTSSSAYNLDDLAPPTAGSSAPFNLDDLAPPTVGGSTPFDLDDMPPPTAANPPFNLDDLAPPVVSNPAPPVFDPAAFAPPTSAAPAFDAPAPPMPWDSSPVETPAAAYVAPAAAPTPVEEPPAETKMLSFEELEALVAQQAAASAVPAAAPAAPAAAPAPIVDLGIREGAHVLPVEEPQAAKAAEETSAALGLGEEGSDPDLVAALNAVVSLKASDLHVTAKSHPMIRVDGSLEEAPNTKVWDEDKLRTVLHSIMSDAQIEKFDAELELDFAYRLSEQSRFRVNVYQQRGAMGAAFRLIPTKIKQLDELGVPASIGKFAGLPRGLVLVTGPTGSGKSTTLAALIDLVNRTRADHVVTVEDPIEFMHENKKSLVNQREVGGDTHSFTAALKHVLRQDPDVILIGELRDLETISVALTAAETGHLVFATLHTQSAAQTIDRVIDVFPPHQQGQIRAQLAATLQGVVCQTLVKHASGSGRVVATEVMITTPAISNLIREGKTYQITSALQAGKDLGMFTLDQHLAELVDQGKIAHHAAMEKAHDLEGLAQMIHRADPGAGMGVPMSNGIDFGDNFSSTSVR